MNENEIYVRRDELQAIVVDILQKTFLLQEKFGPLELQLDLFGDDASRVGDAPASRAFSSSMSKSNEKEAGMKYPPALVKDPLPESVESVIAYLRSMWGDELFDPKFALITQIIQKRNPGFSHDQAVDMMSKFVSTELCRHFAKQIDKWNALDDQGRADWLNAVINHQKVFNFLLNSMRL